MVALFNGRKQVYQVLQRYMKGQSVVLGKEQWEKAL